MWFQRTGANAVTNLRVAAYRGKPVLTWWEGATKQGLGEGAFVVADQTYREIARFAAAAGRPSDLHELILTPRGTAFVSSYETVPMDLTSVGGPKQGKVVGGVVQELELPHGRKLFEWKSLDHVQVSEAHQAVAKGPYDYFHLNSIEPTPDGNLLVSARNTWAVYKVDHGSGAVRWRLGGKRSSFAMAPRYALRLAARRPLAQPGRGQPLRQRRRAEGALAVARPRGSPSIRSGCARASCARIRIRRARSGSRSDPCSDRRTATGS